MGCHRGSSSSRKFRECLSFKLLQNQNNKKNKNHIQKVITPSELDLTSYPFDTHLSIHPPFCANPSQAPQLQLDSRHVFQLLRIARHIPRSNFLNLNPSLVTGSTGSGIPPLLIQSSKVYEDGITCIQDDSCRGNNRHYHAQRTLHLCFYTCISESVGGGIRCQCIIRF